MRTRLLISATPLFAACVIATASFAETKLDTAKIDEATGLKGKWNEQEKTFKVAVPRDDVKVNVDGAGLAPFLGLTSWAAFMQDKMTMVMGDMVLFEDEVNPAMSAALENGLNVTALHNHFFFDEPKVYFMHIGGQGDAGKLAAGVGKVFDTVKQIRAKTPVPGKGFGAEALPAQNTITGAPLEGILGVKGEAKNGMYKAVFGRTTKMPCGCEVGKEMGVNTWAAFAGNDQNAVVDGDFAVLENQLQPALKSLRKSGINIVAIHSHMTGENPRILFLHYWGRGPAADLAKAVKTALDLCNK